LGVELRPGEKIAAAQLEQLRGVFDAVVLAVGEVNKEAAGALGLELAGRALKHTNLALAKSGFFVAGSAAAPSRMAVRAAASGRAAALAVSRFLAGKPFAPAKEFVIHMGKLQEDELRLYLAQSGVSPGPRMGAERTCPPIEAERARLESARCLNCGCAKEHDCRLRECCTEYEAQSTRFRGARKRYEKEESHPEAIYEPGKCISCGRCIQIAARGGEPLGLAYHGRGFNMRVAPPFRESLAAGLTRTAPQAVSQCPTAALSLKPATPLGSTPALPPTQAVPAATPSAAAGSAASPGPAAEQRR
jgi:ferredoxin